MTALSLGAEIATYLQGQGLGLNFSSAGGINLFVSVLPDAPDACVAVFERGGSAPVIWLTGGGTPESKIDNPLLHVRVRQPMAGYTAGNTLINAIYGKLQGITETVLNPGGANFKLIDALQSPVYIGRDAKERHEWSQNFRITWTNLQR